MNQNKLYVYEAPDENGENLIFLLREEDILKDYWDVWQYRMILKYGPHSDLITEEQCIDDWCLIHGAWEIYYPIKIRGEFLP